MEMNEGDRIPSAVGEPPHTDSVTEDDGTTSTTASRQDQPQVVQCTAISSRTWITAVHKKFHHRFVDFLYPTTTGSVATANEGRGNSSGQGDNTSNPNVTLLEAPTEKGRCISRRGYHILLTRNVQREPAAALSPFCRQNISWTVPVRQQIHILASSTGGDNNNDDNVDTNLLKLLASSIVSSSPELPQTSHKVRVDVYPRTLLEDF